MVCRRRCRAANDPRSWRAIGGIDIALWDIKGKAANMPIYRLLGSTRQEVFTYATGGYYVEGAPLTACAEELGQFVAAGYRAVKLKTGALTMDEELVRIRATREAIGDALFMLDMNAPYDVQECIKFARAVEPYGIFWLEEPLHWYLQPADYVRLAAASPFRWRMASASGIALPSAISSPQALFASCSSIPPDMPGLPRRCALPRWPNSTGCASRPTARRICMPTSSPLLAAVPLRRNRTGILERNPIHHGLYTEGPGVRDGMLHLNDLPGFGVEIDWGFVKKHQA